MMQEVPQMQVDVFDEAAAEARFLEDEMRAAPDGGVAFEQTQFAGLQFAVAEVVGRQVGAPESGCG